MHAEISPFVLKDRDLGGKGTVVERLRRLLLKPDISQNGRLARSALTLLVGVVKLTWSPLGGPIRCQTRSLTGGPVRGPGGRKLRVHE